MKSPFYINPDILERPWGSKQDVIVAMFCLLTLIAATFVYEIASDPNAGLPARTGMAISFAGFLFGVFAHLTHQTRRPDEFVQTIFNRATSQAGIATILFIGFVTLYQAVFESSNLGIFTIYAPVLYLCISWLRVRYLTRSFANLTV